MDEDFAIVLYVEYGIVLMNSSGGIKVKDNKPLVSKAKFNRLFNQAMKQALNASYETPTYTNEQIMKSWELVRQKLNAVNENIHSED